ncbi:MAG TPA: SIS domain-containing protein [Phycisphaerae bacterium]|nr:SIS domain-containing protein [Phycisphaerae bacterium]
MNPNDPAQNNFALVREMLETESVIRGLDWAGAAGLAERVRRKGGLFLTGEGSSRIFPAHNAIAIGRRRGLTQRIECEGARQGMEYDLQRHVVFGTSNSGKTREVIELFRWLKARKHDALYGLTAIAKSPLEQECKKAFLLHCGKEDAVAATKSVVEQALFFQVLVSELLGSQPWPKLLGELADKIGAVLTADIDPAIAKRLAAAPTICWAGRNDGVAEELSLKTCEIARKQGVYCEGTCVVHGIEEVLDPGDAVVIIDPYEAELEKYADVLVKGVGLYVVAIAAKKTPFPTIVIPTMADMDVHLQLCAGWNLLVATGLQLGINLDRPVRARKVGNELME